ncbi:hypothetical protein P9112_007649 [Eukaryota sp. TZLM1-RC]
MSYLTTPIKKFPVSEVESLLRNKVSQFFDSKHYSVDDTPLWTRDLADSIRDDVKGFELDRYKYVVQVTIAENKAQGLFHGVQFVWDEDSDRIANYSLCTDSIFCGVSVYALYTY